MNFKNTHFIIALLFIGIGFNACKKGQLGKDICADASFKVTTDLTLSSTNPNMQNSKLNLLAGFSDTTEWWLRIKGKTSGASKEYHGTSDSLNIDWYGNSGTDIFFEAEECSFELELNCKGIVATKTAILMNRPNFKSTNFSMVFNDFDGVGFYNILTGCYNYPGDTSNVHLYRSPITGTLASPQGGQSMYYEANTKDNSNVFFFGGFGRDITSNVGAFIAKTKITNTDSIYLNLYIKGYHSTSPNSQISFSFAHLTEAKNYSIDIDWDGWKMVSIKLSNFISMEGFPSFSIIDAFDMGIGAGPLQFNRSKFELDFIVLSAGAPFKDVQKRNY